MKDLRKRHWTPWQNSLKTLQTSPTP
ncbi:similar to frataxin (predicted) [Rattus norvegicus]|uniref:Similar to frataxin (Predicted) n=1 Tax=Rattus norvegicus TaxID=10116 RepID=A6I0Q3_RAT|nr:similar to frataxin (predicted) [Rattus norvegicus]